jgi:hypothetical protein
VRELQLQNHWHKTYEILLYKMPFKRMAKEAARGNEKAKTLQASQAAPYVFRGYPEQGTKSLPKS